MKIMRRTTWRSLSDFFDVHNSQTLTSSGGGSNIVPISPIKNNDIKKIIE